MSHTTRTPLSKSKGQRSTCRGGAYYGGLPLGLLLLLCLVLQDDIRAMALRVLREMVRSRPESFHSYAELTILKLLEAHKDPVKEVRGNLF